MDYRSSLLYIMVCGPVLAVMANKNSTDGQNFQQKDRVGEYIDRMDDIFNRSLPFPWSGQMNITRSAIVTGPDRYVTIFTTVSVILFVVVIGVVVILQFQIKYDKEHSRASRTMSDTIPTASEFVSTSIAFDGFDQESPESLGTENGKTKTLWLSRGSVKMEVSQNPVLETVPEGCHDNNDWHDDNRMSPPPEYEKAVAMKVESFTGSENVVVENEQ